MSGQMNWLSHCSAKAGCVGSSPSPDSNNILSMRNNKSITDSFIGMKIKIRLPTSWCQVISNSPYQWLKGKVIEIPNNNTIIVNVKSKAVGRIERMMCFRKDGVFPKIIELKK